jgi:hypothetical protein
MQPLIMGDGAQIQALQQTARREKAFLLFVSQTGVRKSHNVATTMQRIGKNDGD